jgi:hypothetical protein
MNGGGQPAPTSRMITPRPVSTTMFWLAACTNVDGPAHVALGNGLPVPRRVTFMVTSVSEGET